MSESAPVPPSGPPVKPPPVAIKARPVFTTQNGGKPRTEPLRMDMVNMDKPMPKPEPKPKAEPKLKPEPRPKPEPKVVAMRKPEPQPEPDIILPTVGQTPIGMQVERMAGVGLPRTAIMEILSLTATELQAYETELRVGIAKANFRVANALFAAASDQKHPKFASCSIFWTKARMGWRDQGEDNSGGLGEPDTGETDEEINGRFENLMGRFWQKDRKP